MPPRWRDPWLVKRLAAQAGVASAEQRIHAAVLEAMTRFLDVARAMMLGEAVTAAAGDDTPPNPDAWPHETVWEQLIRDIILPVLSIVWGEQFRQLAAVADVSDQPYRETYLRTVFDRLKIWPVGAFEEIRPELLEALESSETIAQMRDRIGRVLNIDALSRELQGRINEIERELAREDITEQRRAGLRAKRGQLFDGLHADQGRWRWKADRIARTETMGAYNGGNFAGAQAQAETQDVQLFKQWLATSDERVRLTHEIADGQVVPLNEPFIVGGYALDHPGVAGGPAHEVIQCRCTPLFIEADEAPALVEAYTVKLGKLDPEQAALSLVAAGPGEDITMYSSHLAALVASAAGATGLPIADRGRKWDASAADKRMAEWAADGDGDLTPSKYKKGHFYFTPDGDTKTKGAYKLPFADVIDGELTAVPEGIFAVARALGGARAPLDVPEADVAKIKARVAGYYRRMAKMFDDPDMVPPWMSITAAADNAATWGLPYGWVGVLAPMGKKSGDGRMLAVVDELRTRDMPLVLETQKELQPGHMGAVVAGDIGKVWVNGQDIMGAGRWDLGGADGAEAARLLAEGFARWVSVDPDEVMAEMQWFDKDGKKVEPDPTIEDMWASEEARILGETDPMDGMEQVQVYTDYRLIGATHVAQPAFNEAVIEPVWTEEELDAIYADTSLTASAVPVVVKADPPPLALVAGAGPLAPPVEWFAQADLDKNTPLTITDDGRIYGYVADKDQTHTNPMFAGRSAPPSPSGYAYFHTGAVRCAQGEQVSVGRITLGGGHAPLSGNVRAAAEHYDNTCAAVAVVRAYDDGNGVAVFGALLPDLSPERVAELRRSPLSGDWRIVGGNLEMVAALAVNTAGLPVPRYSMVASGEVTAMVAAGAVCVRPPKTAAPAPAPTLEQIVTLTAAAVVRELGAQEGRRERIAALAARTRPAPARMAELATRMAQVGEPRVTMAGADR
jgi:hypothetical protein